jgi:hypothetical protein
MVQEPRRVIITQNNAAGKSSVLSDKQVDISGVGVFDFWQTFGTIAPDDLSGLAGSGRPFPFFPAEGGTQFRLFTIPPLDATLTAGQIAEISDGFFNAVGWSGARKDTARHPMMHVTPTVDYILHLQGDISLLLDEGDPIPLKPFDAVVQRGTNHAWVNTGKTTALLLCVMVANKAKA